MSTEKKLPSSEGWRIEGKRGRIFTQVYLPGGEYPAPVVVFCHGIPGNERLFDFAIAMREAGFCTVSFHYSGSWGSDGDYSMLNCYEDTRIVLDWVRANNEGLFDTSRIFVVGHSMGGLMSARAISECGFVKGGAVIMPLNVYEGLKAGVEGHDCYKDKVFYDGCGRWLVNFGWDTMLADGRRNLEFFNLAACGKGLSEKPVLTIAGSRDTLLPREQHLDRLIAAIDACGKQNHKALTFDTDHGMNTERNEIKAALAAFLKENC